MPETTVTGANTITFPTLTTWGWEIALYLFLGGLVAGLLIMAGILRLTNGQRFARALLVADWAGLPLLGAGMLLLLLDLSNKVNVWRFYVTFQVTSAISWGAWILLLAMVVLALRFASRLPSLHISGSPMPITGPKKKSSGERIRLALYGAWLALKRAFAWIWNLARSLGQWALKYDRALALLGVALGIGVGFYTGVFLSAMPARPLWNTALLAPLFLVSGLASGGAFLCLLIPQDEHESLVPFSILMCGIELVLLLAFVINLVFGPQAVQRAGNIMLAGNFGLVFWGLVVALGLLVPAVFETLEVLHRRVPFVSAGVPPTLKLIGSVALRFVIVYAGLLSLV